MEKASAPEPARDCFALLHEPRQPWIDPEALKARFHVLAAQFHPDKVAAPTATEKAAANQHYAELNAAYQHLADPKERLRHLLELECGAAPADVQSIPSDAVDDMMEIGRLCREADQFLATRAKAVSPLLKAQLFQAGMAWTDKLNERRARIDLRRDALLAELKAMNADWKTALPRLEQIYRSLGFLNRWAGQMQERLTQLSF